MKDIQVVIGANYGDEGKGLMTDYFASTRPDGIVVRFNGGAQAGHTVQTPDGIRHVFSHFGSGTLSGLPTYLSRFYISNPILFMKEHGRLKDRATKVYVDPRSIVTTPYDMLINQIVESSRGDKRHGSCGVGIYETLVRHNSNRDTSPEMCLNIVDFRGLPRRSLWNILQLIRKYYVPYRLSQLGINEVPDSFKKYLDSDNIIDRYIDDAYNMISLIDIINEDILEEYPSIIFEGAQGLLLDQSKDEFHSTPSNTGMRNVRDILVECGLNRETVNTTYVTRAYMTRHGAGPFATETRSKPDRKVNDPTNVPNEFQGALRYGVLNLYDLDSEITRDLTRVDDLKVNMNLAVSCVDQISDKLEYISGAVRHKERIETFLEDICDTIVPETLYTSYGPTRTTIKGV